MGDKIPDRRCPERRHELFKPRAPRSCKTAPDRYDDGKPLSVESLTRLAIEVFKTTPDSDRRLRNIMYLHVKENFARLMKRLRFEVDMDQVESFWADYARFLSNFIDVERISFKGVIQESTMLIRCYNAFYMKSSPVDARDRKVDEDQEKEIGTPRKRKRSLSDEDGGISTSVLVSFNERAQRGSATQTGSVFHYRNLRTELVDRPIRPQQRILSGTQVSILGEGQ
ncbi:hypothetical protein IWX47DRAFT_841139 [Phyllosticta citricarpa]